VLQISKKNRNVSGEINISGSKSESNRLLILRAYTSFFNIINISDSEDTQAMSLALESTESEINIGHAGTAMRFLTSFFSTKDGSSKILTGSERMKKRPIEILVNALNELGGDIKFLENHGFPPIKINGKRLVGNAISLPANVSSQYISSLIMLGSSFENGLKINLSTETTSLPYIIMTKKIIERLGGIVKIEEESITIDPIKSNTITDQYVESDWSSASYFYSLVAMSSDAKITLSSFFENSIQGDSNIVKLYEKLGVETIYNDNKIVLRKIPIRLPKNISVDLRDNPDIAQTIIVTCLGLGVNCNLSGLHTLKIKETDRLSALKNEIEKFHVDRVSISEDSIKLVNNSQLKPNVIIETYDDHRMAMSFAPLSLITPIKIVKPDVVTKSYRNFWSDLKSLGFDIIEKN
tara:strand:- start:20340 stop:21566 length:1227 start_codon:yes stop_codon:yes gene_type:complete